MEAAEIQPETKSQIFMLLALRRAQENFVEQLCSRAGPSHTSLRSSKKDARIFLRDHQDKVVRIAEFFFLMRAIAPLTSERVETIVREHNARLQRKIEATEDLWTSSKLQKGLFSPNAIRMLGMNNTDGDKVSLSQSDLARFFCETMSDELTRNVVTVLVDASILISASAWYNAKLICSSGILEDSYANYLDHILDAARLDGSSGPGRAPYQEAFESLSADPVFSILRPLFKPTMATPVARSSSVSEDASADAVIVGAGRVL